MARPGGRSYFSFAVAAALLVLLAVLAVLQYRWIGEVSQAEGERLRATLASAAARFGNEFDHEIARAFAFFLLDPQPDAATREARLVERYADWAEHVAHPQLVREILRVFRDDAGAWHVRRLEAAAGRFVDADWPADLGRLRARLEAGPPWPGPGRRRPPGPPVLEEAGALVVPAGGPLGAAEAVVLRLDRDFLGATLLPELAERYFGAGDGAEYDLAVVRRDDPQTALYRSDPGLPLDRLDPPDASVELLGLRPFPELHGPGPGFPPGAARRFRDGEGRPGMGRRFGEGRPGLWRLLVKHRSGSLEAVVARARRRNLALGSGILSLLAVTVVMLAASTRRAHGLARQRMEFVAAVTHELHTPLAGIRSAAQNLKDGVVAESGQVRRYGALLEKESRRLSELLQQVLEFSGIQSGRRVYRKQAVEVARLVEEALGSCRWVLEEKDVTVETDVAPDLPAVEADPDALLAAFRNVIANGAKYGGGWLRLRAVPVAGGSAVAVSIEDRGPGVPAVDRARIFEPFYRGQQAADNQAAGTGLGLAIVKEVIDAHGGTVDVHARAEGGSCFTLRLPAARADGRPEPA